MAVKDDDVADSEELYRRIPVSQNWYDPALKAPPSPRAFRPHPKRDTTGLSVFRAKYVSPEQLCQNMRDDQYYVAVLRTGDLREHGLKVVAVPVEDMPGHAEIPDLKSDTRKATEELQLLLAHKLCRAVLGPFPSRAPISRCGLHAV